MVNYNNSIIYKIVCKDINVKEFYVGSTTNFNRRKQQHKSESNNSNSKKYNYTIYQFIRDNGKFENWDMLLIEKYNCNDKLELHKREREYIETLGASLNKNIPSRTIKEYKEKYYENNKDKLTQSKHKYYIDNKAEIAGKNKEYRENNKDIIKQRKKDYANNNKPVLKQKAREWRENNKDTIRKRKQEYSSEKVKCDICNKEIRKGSLSRHKKTLHT
jgi:hypothetical protein